MNRITNIIYKGLCATALSVALTTTASAMGSYGKVTLAVIRDTQDMQSNVSVMVNNAEGGTFDTLFELSKNTLNANIQTIARSEEHPQGVIVIKNTKSAPTFLSSREARYQGNDNAAFLISIDIGKDNKSYSETLPLPHIEDENFASYTIINSKNWESVEGSFNLKYLSLAEGSVTACYHHKDLPLEVVITKKNKKYNYIIIVDESALISQNKKQNGINSEKIQIEEKSNNNNKILNENELEKSENKILTYNPSQAEDTEVINLSNNNQEEEISSNTTQSQSQMRLAVIGNENKMQSTISVMMNNASEGDFDTLLQLSKKTSNTNIHTISTNEEQPQGGIVVEGETVMPKFLFSLDARLQGKDNAALLISIDVKKDDKIVSMSESLLLPNFEEKKFDLSDLFNTKNWDQTEGSLNIQHLNLKDETVVASYQNKILPIEINVTKKNGKYNYNIIVNESALISQEKEKNANNNEVQIEEKTNTQQVNSVEKTEQIDLQSNIETKK